MSGSSEDFGDRHILQLLSESSPNKSSVILFLLDLSIDFFYGLNIVESVDVLGLELTTLGLHNCVLFTHNVVSIVLNTLLFKLV